MLKEKDILILRTLAEKYMSIATLPVQDKTRDLWYALNRRQAQKPMVLIDQMPWNELMEESLVCQIVDPYWRGVENELRRALYRWEHLPVDMALPPYICLPRSVSLDGPEYGLVIKEETRGDAALVHSHEYQDILQTEEDLEKIRPAKVLWDREGEARHLEEAHRIFDGIAPVRMSGITMHLGLWDRIAKARGVTECYMDLYDRPEHLHAIMRRMTDSALSLIDQYDAIRAFDNAKMCCHCSLTYSDDLPVGTDGVGGAQSWAFGMAQLFSSVSPDITEEYEISYVKELFSRFGAIYYGCCEKLDDRLELVDQLPNIRKVSCSPWSDCEAFAEKLNKKYIMSNKPNPALLATPDFDEALVRTDLRRTMKAARDNGLALEMILKDISTIKNDPSRLWRWAQIAAEETANF